METKQQKLSNIHLRIEIALVERLKRFCNSFQEPIKYSKIIRDLIDKFLKEKGY